MTFAANICFHLWNNQHDRWGKPMDIPWSRFVNRMQIHIEGTKDGSAFSCATCDGPRGNDHMVERTMVALDIEQNLDTGEIPPDPKDVAAVLKARGMASCLYTSFSHTPQLPRYRIVAPLDVPIKLATIERGVDRLISGNFAMTIMRELIGVTDKSKWGSSSIFYLPRHPPGVTHFYCAGIEGEALPSDVLLKAAVMGNDRRAMAEAQRAALKAASMYSEEDRELIERFNADHDIEQLMENYGYKRGGNRWKSPHQHAQSQPGVVVMRGENRLVSHSDSDHSAGVGNWSEEGGCMYCDAAGLMQAFECGNNFGALMKKLREMYPKVAT